jgi:hypothetical protein
MARMRVFEQFCFRLGQASSRFALEEWPFVLSRLAGVKRPRHSGRGGETDLPEQRLEIVS